MIEHGAGTYRYSFGGETKGLVQKWCRCSWTTGFQPWATAHSMLAEHVGKEVQKLSVEEMVAELVEMLL